MTRTTTRVLQRLLDEPDQVRIVRALDPPHFGALVTSVGLEDAGELLAMATPSQVLEVLDREVWHDDPLGPESRLDASRFAVWLEVLLEAGDEAAARRLGQLPESLLTAGLCAQLFVLEIDGLGHDRAAASVEESQWVERVLDECLYLELGRYVLVARDALSWDPTVAALLALDRIDHDLVIRILEHGRAATHEHLAQEGFETILRAQQTLEADALAERDDRRAREGHVARSDARSFLALADRTQPDDAASREEDPVTRAYFRQLERRPRPPASSRSVSLRALLGSIEGLAATGSEGSMEPAASASAVVDEPAVVRTPGLREAMQALHDADPERHADQLSRLAYLANVVISGGEARSALEASALVMRVVASGLEQPIPSVDQEPVARLQRIGVDVLFRIGWRRARPTQD